MDNKAYLAYGVLVVIVISILFLGDSNSMGNDITGFAARDVREPSRLPAYDTAKKTSASEKLVEDQPIKGKVSGTVYIYRDVADSSTAEIVGDILGSDKGYLPAYFVSTYINTNVPIKNIYLQVANQPGSMNAKSPNAPLYLKDCLGKTSCSFNHYLFPSKSRSVAADLFSDMYAQDFGEICAFALLKDYCTDLSVDVKITLDTGEEKLVRLKPGNDFYYSSTAWGEQPNDQSLKSYLHQNMIDNNKQDVVSGYGAWAFGWRGLCNCNGETPPAKPTPPPAKAAPVKTSAEVACSDTDVTDKNYQSLQPVNKYGYINPYVQGTVDGKDEYGKWELWTDKCVPNKPTKVTEYFCNYGKNIVQQATELDCPKGTTCQDGACVEVKYTGPIITAPIVAIPFGTVTPEGQICFPAPNDGTFTFKYDKTKGKAYLELNPNKK